MNNQINEILQDLGLSHNETEVYLAMLKTGEETASKISSLAKLNRVTTYSLLKSLSEKGFCGIFEKNNVQYFRAVKPKDIIGLLEEKKNKIKAVLPNFTAIQNSSGEKPEIAIYDGKNGLTTMFSLLLNDAESKHEVLGYGNVSIAEKVIQYQSLYWRKTRLLKKIKMRAVSDSLGDTDHSSPPEWKKLTDVRTNKEFEKLRTYVIITKNYVSYSGLSEEPYGILIKSKETVEREKMIFEIFWKSCKSKA